MKPLLLIGNGGHALSCMEVAISAGWEPRMFQGLMPDGPAMIVFGSIAPRISMFLELGDRDLPVIIASTAVCPGELGRGTALFHHSLVNAGAVVGENCIVNTGAIVEHGSCIGDHCHISTGAIVNGDCVIGSRTFIGSHATVIQGIRICEGCIIGAGAVVHKDITEPGTYVGVPARRVK